MNDPRKDERVKLKNALLNSKVAKINYFLGAKKKNKRKHIYKI
jgi:hypothetical protein